MNADSESHNKLNPDSPENHKDQKKLDHDGHHSPKQTDHHDNSVKAEHFEEENKNSSESKENTSDAPKEGDLQAHEQTSHQDSNQVDPKANESEKHAEHIQKGHTQPSESEASKAHIESTYEVIKTDESNEPHHETIVKADEHSQSANNITDHKHEHNGNEDESSKVHKNGVNKHTHEEDIKNHTDRTSLVSEKTHSDNNSATEALKAEKSHENAAQTDGKAESKLKTKLEIKTEENSQPNPQRKEPDVVIIEQKQEEQKKSEPSTGSVTKLSAEDKAQAIAQAKENFKGFFQKVEGALKKKEQTVEPPQKQSTVNDQPNIGNIKEQPKAESSKEQPKTENIEEQPKIESIQIKEEEKKNSVAVSRRADEFVEQIPIDKLDYMSTYQRFTEFDLMIEKALSLKKKNKLENAASVFEMAADIMNPIYFREAPQLLPKVQKHLVIGLCSAAACHFATDHFYEAAKNAYYAFKLDPRNLEALYYLGMSKMKLGDIDAAARAFVIAKRTRASSANKPFKKKMIAQLAILVGQNPEIDTKKIEAKVAMLFPNKLLSRRSLIYAMGGFIPATVVMYLILKKLKIKMSRRRGLLTSISSGVLLGVISYLISIQ